jgi:thymidylate synthase ThyX
MISARVLTDSIGERSPRLTTFLTRYPKFVHAEHCRHRTHSFCVSSSRAIPLSKTLEEVRSDELRAAPVFWGAEQKGMSPGEELADYPPNLKSSGSYVSPKIEAQIAWTRAAMNAAHEAEQLQKLGVHKSICNRILDPFLHVNVLDTSCEPGLLNWFGLRLDKSADPTIRALAEAMWAAWNESTPKKLEPGEWHLPFIDGQTLQKITEFETNQLAVNLDILDRSVNGLAIRVSVARCARLSYTSFETGKRSTIEEDLALYDRLITARPIHASPAEHQATPDVRINQDVLSENFRDDADKWKQPKLHGNLPGWRQFRKTLPGEAVAPLPEGYAQ